jgi:hypothetical protein
MVSPIAFLDALGGRLQRGHVPQYGFLLLSLSALALAVLWPSGTSDVHEVWYRFAPFRSLAASLFAIGFGFGLPHLSRSEGLVLSAAVMLVVMATLPLESLAYLRSLPAVGGAWLWWGTPLVVAGQLALGAWLGWWLRRIGLLVIAPVLVPLALVGLVLFDLQVGVSLLNPWTAPLSASWTYPALHGLLALTASVRGWLGRREVADVA